MDAVFKPGGGPDASPPLPKIVVGKKLSRRRKGINPSHLALLAVEEARKQFQQQALEAIHAAAEQASVS